MDVTPYTRELRIAPRAVFDSLPERGARARFMVPDGSTWSEVTWNDFACEIREIALFLASLLRAEDRAAIYAPNRVAWASAALAIQAAGGAMVPVYPASTSEQAAYVVSHSDAKVLFVDTPALLARTLEAWDALANVSAIVLLSDDLDVAGAIASLEAKGKKAPDLAAASAKVHTWSRARAIGRARDLEDPSAFERAMDAVSIEQMAVMLYTSGTSGNPKGVPLTHRNVATNGRDWLESNAPLLDERAVDILWLPMSHIFGFGQMCLGNTLGFLTYLSDPVTCLTRMPEVQPSVFMSVPSHWEKLALLSMHEPTPEAKRAKFREVTGGKLRFCLSGGAGLKREIKDFFHEQGVLVIEGYGLTETSPTLTLNRPDAFRFDSVGKPLPTVELRLAEDGEILAKGPNVFSGYHKDPDATKEAFTEDGWFKTGDVGRFTDDGFLQIVDRKKDILVTAGGKNVPPANIEIRFKDDPFILHAVVYGEGKKYLVLGVWPNDAAVDAELRDVPSAEREHARRALLQGRIDLVNGGLASYETIKKFTIVDQPLTVENELLTASFKLRRKKVYERFRADFEALYAEGKPAERSA